MKCPICKKNVDDPRQGEPPGSYPFCSDRCKLIDLGRWLDGKYQIPVAEADEDGPTLRRGLDLRPGDEDDGEDQQGT